MTPSKGDKDKQQNDDNDDDDDKLPPDIPITKDKTTYARP